MKKLLLIISVFLICQKAISNHSAGGYISYSSTSIPNNYDINLILYWDCSGALMPPNDTLCISSASCGNSFQVVATAGVPSIVQHCFGITLGISTCFGGTQYGLKKYIYTANVTLPLQCSDWEIVYSIIKYNPFISNTFPIVLRTTLNNLNQPANSSPVIINDHCFISCVANNLCFSIGAADNDSLEYVIEDADTSGDYLCPLPYQPVPNPPSTYSYANPAYYILNSANGLLCYNMPFISSPIISYRINEYASGSLKSFTKGFFYMYIVAGNISCFTPIKNNPKVQQNLSTTYSNHSLQILYKGTTSFSEINVYDVFGKLVFKQPFNYQNKSIGMMTFFLPDLSNGIYFCSLTNPQGEIATVKFSAK